MFPSLVRLLRPRFFPGRAARHSDSGFKRAEEQPILSAGSTRSSPQLLFEPLTTHGFVAPLDCDVNIHKSNSTFFTDADVSRAELLTRRFAGSLAGLGPNGQPANAILAGTSAQFIRELKPFQRYDVVSRVLTWNEASFYLATYFLKKGVDVPAPVSQSGDGVAGPQDVIRELKAKKAIYAVLITRYVVRSGRVRIAPSDLLKAAGMLGNISKDESGSGVEDARISGLECVKGFME